VSPTVSIVVPTYNRWFQLLRTLEGLAAQTVPSRDVEVIVVSDGSTDATDEHLQAGRSPIDIVFHRQANSGPAVARNKGIALASADLVLFIDDDVVALPSCVAAHLRAHESGGDRQVVIGPLLAPPDHELDPWVWWEQRTLDEQYDSMQRGEWAASPRQFYTGNASLHRSEITAVGGFDPTFRRAEDVELAYRLARRGLTFTFDYGAGAHHYAERSFQAWLSNAKAYGRNDAIMWRDGGVDWLYPTLCAEYQRRNPLVRAHTAVGLRLPPLQRAGERIAPTMATTLSRLGLSAVAQRLLSAVYNLAYYQELLDELGDSSASALRSPRPSPVMAASSVSRRKV
jgi:GT2 family glycosyltransferase